VVFLLSITPDNQELPVITVKLNTISVKVTDLVIIILENLK
jgi:hypothetical protein